MSDIATECLNLLTNIDDIFAHVKRFNKILNDDYFICVENVNPYIVRTVSKKNIQNQYLSQFDRFTTSNSDNYMDKLLSELLKSLEFDNKTTFEMLNDYTNIAFIISNNCNKLLIKRSNSYPQHLIKILLNKNIINIDKYYKELLILSILFEVFDVTKILLETDSINIDIKNQYNKDALAHILELQHYNVDIIDIYEHLDKLFGYDQIDFYDSKYKSFCMVLKQHNIYQILKYDFVNIIKLILFYFKPDESTIKTLIHEGVEARAHPGVFKAILTSPKYKLEKDFMLKTLRNAICNTRIEIVNAIVLHYEYIDDIINDNICEPMLIQANRLDSDHIIKLFLNNKNIDINISIAETDHHRVRKTLLNIVIEKKNYKMIDLLLKRKDIDVNLMGFFNESALFSAIKIGDKDLIRRLLERPDININVKNYYDADSPLILLIEKGYMDLAKIILNNKSLDINYTSSHNFTILITAIVENRYEFVKLILKHKNVNLYKRIHWHKTNAFDMAKELKHTEILKLLNAYDPNVGI